MTSSTHEKRISVTHIISGLELGGAESVLYRLIERSRHCVQHRVVSLTTDGFYSSKIRALDVPVLSIGLTANPLSLSRMRHIWRYARKERPDLVQCWMYHADLLGGVVCRFASDAPILWGIRNSDLDPEHTALTTRLIARVCAVASHTVPNRIISCSHRAAMIHAALGYCADRITIIPNGIDTQIFAPSETNRQSRREALGFGAEHFVLGHVGRWDPQKDHETLIRAVALARRRDPSIRCVLVGTGVQESNLALVRSITAAGMRDYCHLFGPAARTSEVMCAFDALVMSSAYGEAFPNVVAEAMACGVPAVVTDVGDAAKIVDRYGWTCRPRDPAALADALLRAVESIRGDGRQAVARNCRAHIVAQYSMESMVGEYCKLWRDVASVTAAKEGRS